ncbi:hypothetical protein KQY30_20030 [Streptomyces sp. GMY02]|uniref:DUF6197 family protein n=1 Tax=Streptomyces sp. GMY02 TaxID=1333528 RepID=UPI001C2C1511|nr:hypothetical protein [Streptomyces sp. GMY02]QXE36189.1 hypothetical protein KQY30_20030 [Streptomyces sp. GMY02]
MLTLSVTPSRVAAVLHQAAITLAADGWDPYLRPMIAAVDRAAGFTKPGIDPAAEETTLQAWDTLGAHLGEQAVEGWERAPGRTTAEVCTALHAAAGGGTP